MAKARKGLIISLLTLIIAIVVTTTSTYAWFAMNTEVNATNMQVKAIADTTFLVIQKTPSGTGEYEGKMGAVTTTSVDFALAQPADIPGILPAKYKSINTSTGAVTWQQARGTTFENGTAVDGYTDIAVASESHYVAKFTFYVGLNPVVSQVNASDLKVSKLILTKVGDADSVFFDALSVLVVADGATIDNYVDAGHSVVANPDNNNAVELVAGSNTVLANTINHDGTPIKIDVYIYINGDNSHVTTSNATVANLGQYTASIGFTCTPGSIA